MAFLEADQGDVEEAARLAGYARSVHPSLATRSGVHRACATRLYERLKEELSPEALELALAEGGRWPLSRAVERAQRILDRPAISNN